MWRSTYAQQNQRFEDRQTINQEMFGIYNAMRNGFDVINATANKNAFDLYKYSRDSKDELAGQIGELKTELAVLKATRPYQDALIQCDIRRVAEHADFNLWRRTCRMISGEVVLPNTLTVTGYASYNPCACPATTPAPNSVRDKVANSPRGKELLEKQLNNIRAKKDSIIEEANKELELFKKFQIAAQANPKLTYVDFCNNIKNKEV